MGRIIVADAIDGLRELEDEIIDCCVTSPPYYGLRDYGVDGQIGLEDTPCEYVNRLKTVFREVRRVLKGDGTLWLNIGDSYASGRNGGKQKDLIGIPWMLAFALKNDGWYLRQEIIWAKPNPMPESVTDRCTKSHESIFLLSKSHRYYFDSDAIKENAVSDLTRSDISRGSFGGKRHAHADIKHVSESFRAIREKRNKRDVWTVPTSPFKGAHFAVFPPELVRPCVLAGCPEGGTVLDPFGGSGTTALVAAEAGRDYVLIELNPEYARMAEERVRPVEAQGRLAL